MSALPWVAIAYDANLRVPVRWARFDLELGRLMLAADPELWLEQEAGRGSLSV